LQLLIKHNPEVKQGEKKDHVCKRDYSPIKEMDRAAAGQDEALIPSS
jgi:hypothetical protein